MKPKIKIPKKDYDTSWFIVSVLAFLVVAFTIVENIKTKTPDFSALAMVCFCSAFFLPIVFYYRNRYRYYAPRFRTIEIRSLKEMCDFHQLMYIANDDFIGFHLLLRAKDFRDEFFVNLSVPDEEVDFFEFCKQKETFQKDYGRIIAISFLMTHPNGDELIPKRPAYKFWGAKAVPEEHMYFIKEAHEATPV